jgi:hypothetical protein
MSSEREVSRQEIAEIAKSMMEGSIRPLLGVRESLPFLHNLEKEIDPKIYMLFVGVNSETDGLPIRPERAYWATGPLREKDEAANNYEARVRDKLINAAEKLYLQFFARNSSLL